MVLPADQHRVGGMQLEESDMTCQATCSSSRTSRAAHRDSVVAGGHRTATGTTAAGLKERGSIATDLSPHAGRRRQASQWPRLRQSTGSWFVVEYDSQALHHIGTVLGPTSGAKGTAPLTLEAVVARASQSGGVSEVVAVGR